MIKKQNTILVIFMAMVFAACGSDKKDPAKGNPNNPPPDLFEVASLNAHNVDSCPVNLAGKYCRTVIVEDGDEVIEEEDCMTIELEVEPGTNRLLYVAEDSDIPITGEVLSEESEGVKAEALGYCSDGKLDLWMNLGQEHSHGVYSLKNNGGTLEFEISGHMGGADVSEKLEYTREN